MDACSFLVRAEKRAFAMLYKGLPNNRDLNHSPIKLLVSVVLVPLRSTKIISTKSAGSVPNLINKCDYFYIDTT
jgi:hypothetical protein